MDESPISDVILADVAAQMRTLPAWYPRWARRRHEARLLAAWDAHVRARDEPTPG